MNSQKLQQTIKNIFTTEIREFSWFNDEFIHSSINNFYSDLNTTFDNFRDEFSTTDDELIFIHNQVRKKGRDRHLNRKYNALARKLEQMRNGEQPYDTYGYLSNYGFLPNYGFPSESLHLTMFNPNKTEYLENWRSSVIAIREYAPHNQVYFLGNKYNINKAIIKTDLGEIKEDKVYICPFCNEIIMDTPTTSSISLTECPNCHEEIQLSKFMSSIKFPHMYSRSGPRITCDEEKSRNQRL